MRVCVCLCVGGCDVCVFFMCTVSGWLCVRGQSWGTVPLHLWDSFYLPGTLTGKATSLYTHTRIILCIQVHLHTCACLLLTLSYPLPGVCACVPVCVCECEYLWLHSSRSSLECNSRGGSAARSLPLSTALSPSPGAHLCWLPVASCTVNVKSCHFAQMHK